MGLVISISALLMIISCPQIKSGHLSTVEHHFLLFLPSIIARLAQYEPALGDILIGMN